MSDVALTEAFLSRLAGWAAMKQARSIVAADRVLSSDWSPPILKGVVQSGDTTYRAGLRIQSERDIENLCPCRESRQWGTICAHSVAVGLHHLAPPAQSAKSAAPEPAPAQPDPPRRRLIRRADAAESELTLHLVLPPNLEASLGRGRIMISLEAAQGGRRTPLPAVSGEMAFRLDAPDQRLLNVLEPIVEGERAAAWQLSRQDWVRLLPALAGHPRVTLGRKTPVQISASPWVPALEVHRTPGGELVLRGRESGPLPLILEGAWVYRDATFQPFGLPPECARLSEGPVTLSRREVPLFLHRDWPALVASEAVHADFDPADFVLGTATPEFHLFLRGGLAMLDATLQCRYGGLEVRPGRVEADAGLFLPDPLEPNTYHARDLAAEQDAVARLARAGFQGPDKQGVWRLRDADGVLDFFATEYPRVHAEWKVTMEERLEQSTKRNLERIEPQFRWKGAGEGWLDLSIAYDTTQGTPMSPAEIQRLLRGGRRHGRLPNGKVVLIDTGAVEELQEVLRDASPRQEASGYRLAASQRGFLEMAVRDLGWSIQGQAAGRPPVPRPEWGSLESVLRPYQKEGVAWMCELAARGFGGVLADEMGLGKTVQTLAFLSHRASTRRQAGEPSLPSLVVCPTSLVSNWLDEATRFTPDLRAVALQGPQRHLQFPQVAEADLVLTSYALLRRDIDTYRGWSFDTVILDEAQHIKNRQTQNARAVKGIRARNRLVLTGTPLENSVLDLWSIFDFLMPGYLGAEKDFRERYEVPLTQASDPATQARLQRRIRPFLLRRRKQEVARDLPDKLEQVAYCELTQAQRAVYHQLLEAGRREVDEAVRRQGLGPSRWLVINTLLRLRQACCDLRLLDPEAKADTAPSGKVELFMELLEEVIDGGHRVLVFSQFVSMLHLLRAQLEAEDVGCCYLDGSTRDRAGEVRRFQTQPKIPVFLISLKAGGVGLNLTGADTVIHFDPWWNPAVEAQATDRAHRIGQTRTVTSYKLITRDSVEEKILKLQERKRSLIRGALGSEEELAEAVTWEDVQGLLQA